MTFDQKEAAEIAERGYSLAVRDGKTHVTLTRERLRTILDALAASQPAPAANTDDETYEIGKRDGYEKAVQDIDLLTGGDGEYRFCTNEDPDRHTPTPEAMIQRIVDRFGALTAADTGQAVAWQRRLFGPKVKDGNWHTITQEQADYAIRHGHPEGVPDVTCEVRPLYTHPAPLDAERVRELKIENARLRLGAERYLASVAALGQQSGYNNLTFFECPILKAPDAIGEEANRRWVELNDAGVFLRAALRQKEGA